MKARLVSIFAAISLAACGGGSGGTSTSTDNCKALDSTEFSCSQSMNNVVDLAMVPAAAAFADLVETLNTQVAAYCADNTDAAKQTAARTAWQQAMLQWQELDVMQFGPLDAETRSYIYTWPESDTCKVDETVVLAKQAGFDVAITTPPRRGLDALEYLLFNESLTLSCADTNKTQAMIAWESGAEANKKADRCDYAKLVAANLEQKATELEASARAYDVDGQNPSLQGFANSMSDALFYVDKLTKDSKLGEVLPAANRISFTADKLEFQYADINLEAIRSNLIGALAVINGGNGGGLDDYLAAAGQKDLADTMKAKLQTAIDASADANISTSYRDLINGGDADACYQITDDDTNNFTRLCSLDDKIKDFTDDLKNQFVLNLGFSTPNNAEGDND